MNIQDLVLVASSLGKTGPDHDADVNADGVVNVQDLVKVAGAFGEVAAAPSLHPQALAMFTAADVQQWLSQAEQLAPDRCNVAKGHSLLRATFGGVDSQRDRPLAQLSESVQP